MKPETREWVAKAEGDISVARRELRTRRPVWDVICFLCQQCAEKYLKAMLEEHDAPVRKSHDLVVLLDSGTNVIPELELIREELSSLGQFGIAARYPGENADRAAAKIALTVATQVRRTVRARLGLTNRSKS